MARNIIKHGSQSAAMILVVIGIVVCVNIIAARFFVRADLTENKEFTITESTKSILQKIDDIVNIKVYFSKDLPPYLTNLESQIRDMLDEYRAYAGNNLAINFIDPKSDPELEQKLMRLGIPELQLTVIEKDQRQVRKAYLGLSVQYGDKNEVIPVVKNIENIEYDLTRAIFKVTDSEERMVGWVGNRNPQDQTATGYEEAQKALEEEYAIRNYDPAKMNTIPKNIKALIVDGNQVLSERAKYAIDQFIMNGGKAIIMMDAIKLAEEGLNASAVTQDIQSLVEHYGVAIAPKLVIDRSNAYASFNSGFMRFSLPYPFWPKIQTKGFDASDPAVSKLESLVLPWVSPLTAVDNIPASVKVTQLIKTSEGSAALGEPFDLNPQQRFNIKPEDQAHQIMAIRLDGKFKSYFEGKPIPAEMQDPQGAPPKEKQSETTVNESVETSIVVLASSRFINNQFAQMFPENLLFMHNLTDSFVIGDQLIGIRSRQVTDRPLDYGTSDEVAIERKKSTHRLLGTFAIPALTIAFGLVRVSLRRNRRKTLAVTSNGR